MTADFALRLARLLVRREQRDRRFEEWQADVAGSAELGISAGSITRGAIVLAARARAADALALLGRVLRRLWTPAVGVLLGAVCAVAGIPVLTVVALALLLQGGVLGVARRRAQDRRLRHHAEPTR